MSRRNPPAKWTLPNTTHPVGRKCFMLSVPDDPYYIAAYRGAIWALASAYNWQDDEEHTAKEVAQEWRDCIESGDCMEFRQDDCGLYVTINGIETLIYDGQLCINKNIADGTLAKANSGYIGNIPRSDCKSYTVKLDMSVNTWLAPNVVSSGDTILLSNWQGGATDLGQLSTFWTCPSGTAYALGMCSDVPRVATSYGTDPLQSAPHLAVIGQIGSTYYDIWNSGSGITPATFTVPAGVTNQPLRLMMNVSSLVGLVATGEMWGEVTICNLSQWCYSVDFTASNGGFVRDPDEAGRGAWVAGQGWHDDGVIAGSYRGCYIKRTFAQSTTLLSLDMEYSLTPGANYDGYIRNAAMQISSVPGNVVTTGDTPNPVSHVHLTWEGGNASTYIRLIVGCGHSQSGDPGGSAWIYRLTLTGSGYNPFGASNC